MTADLPLSLLDTSTLSDVMRAQDAAVGRAAYAYLAAHSDADILIAATALTHGLSLVTENPSHFRRIPDLPVESWRTRE